METCGLFNIDWYTVNETFQGVDYISLAAFEVPLGDDRWKCPVREGLHDGSKGPIKVNTLTPEVAMNGLMCLIPSDLTLCVDFHLIDPLSN